MVFVFGSNLSGIHGAGAAKYAHRFHGAEWGVGSGPTGNCYALPTKGKNITFMDIQQIRENVEAFLVYAYSKPEQYFQVTKVGCGLGGFTNEDIAPMFIGAPENCLFDTDWQPFLGDRFNYWGSV